jgi:hypothetical protein
MSVSVASFPEANTTAQRLNGSLGRGCAVKAAEIRVNAKRQGFGLSDALPADDTMTQSLGVVFRVNRRQ